MSRTREEQISCPSCGGAIKVTLWDSINAQMDMDDAKSLMEGTLFEYVCPFCGTGISVDNPLLYNDMLHRAMIYYAEDTPETRDMIKRAIDKSGLTDYTNRLVSDRAALAEKAAIFAAGYDDRVMEITKLVYLSQAAEDHPDGNIKRAFFLLEDGKPKIELLGDTCLTAPLSEDLYESVAERFAAVIDAAAEELTIDMAWAMAQV